MKIKNIALKIYFVITIAIVILLVLNYAEILMKNLNPNPIYSPFNMIVRLCTYL